MTVEVALEIDKIRCSGLKTAEANGGKKEG